MSSPTREVSVKGLRKTHFEQLMQYIYSREDSGIYYGRKDQFIKRHIELKQWCEEIIGGFK